MPPSKASQEGAQAIPWEQLTGQPLIYASMGTVLSRVRGVFPQIAAACAELDIKASLQARWDRGEQLLL